MSTHISRALLLYHQSRYDAAEKEVRQALIQHPQDSHAHALLGLCLMRQDKLPEAQAETEQAIVLEPDEPYPHYCRSIVTSHRNHYAEAEQSAREAIRLNPTQPDYHAQLAVTLFQQEKWQASHDAVMTGLQYDAEHAGCNNIRSMALTKLGRQDESIAAVDQNLANDPDDEFAHANKGWALLHEGKPYPALEHFREALRLDPNFEYAQMGIVEALKARNFLYRWMLAYFLWMARLDNRARWGVVIGGYIGARILRSISRTNPDLEIYIAPLLFIYLAFVLLTWFAVPFFNLLLRLNKFGRHALSRDDRISSNWFGLCVLVGITSIAIAIFTPFTSALMFALFAAGMALPLVTIYSCDVGWPRRMMTFFTAGMACLGLTAIATRSAGLELGNTLALVFLLGVFFTPWVANYLVSVTPRQ